MKNQTPKPRASDGSFYCFGKKVLPPQQSIHPRVVRGRTAHAKVNTAKAPRVK